MTARSGFTWDVSLKTVAQRMAGRVRDVPAQVEGALADLAPEITDWMKQNAPWTDRTGMARASLNTLTSREGTDVTLTLLYDDPAVYYSVYLEYSMGGRFAILGPAIDYWYPKVLDAVKRALTGLRMRVGRRETRFES